ncbi:16516_t:CDS:2, partial [Racocetra persica]
MTSTSNVQASIQKTMVWRYFKPSIEEFRKKRPNTVYIQTTKTVSSEDFTVAIPQLSEHIFREVLVKGIVIDNLLFTTVESESF